MAQLSVIEYQVIGKDPIILLHDLFDAGMDMSIVGKLKYDKKNKCILLYNSMEDIIVSPIWPKGTIPYSENNLRGVQIPGYGTILEGSDISTTGGGIDLSEIVDLDYPSECLVNENIVIINSDI